METKRKKRLLNVVMIFLILIITASGVVTVGKIQGWFDREKEISVVCGDVKGIVNIERKGIGYTLKKDTGIEAGDILETRKGAQVQLILNDRGMVSGNGDTEVKVTTCEKEKTGIEVTKGEIFGDTISYDGSLEVGFGGKKAMLSGAAFSVSVQSGSSTLQVYSGDISVTLSDGTVERVETGEYLSCFSSEDGKESCSVEKIQIASMNEFQITQAKECGHSEKLCFTGEELQKVLDDRTAEKQAAIEASMKANETVHTGEKKEITQSAKNTQITENSDDSDIAYTTENVGESSYDGSKTEENVIEEAEKAADTKTCTIEIRCDTILNNMGNLDEGKEAYVPANGTILATSPVEFEEGETVFDVLKRVCDYAGIQIEYSWTPMYDSYYIEGINNLYEFDCGNESGWMYKVNGWFPNYGCSSYTLEDGDVIVWCYTCNGLGADVGGSAY